MPPKPRIRRRINLLHLPTEIIALVVRKIRLEELYSLRLTCSYLHNLVNAYVEALLPHHEDYDVIIAAKSILAMPRIQVIPLVYVIAPSTQDELLALAKHPNLRCLTLDLTYMKDVNFLSCLDAFLTSFNINKDYDISFVYKDEEAFRLVGNQLILSQTSSTSNLLTKLSSFHITSYRGGYMSGLSTLPNLTSITIVKPQRLDGLDNLLTPKITSLSFDYLTDEIGGCSFHITDFINKCETRQLRFPTVTHLGPVGIQTIHKVGFIFPNVEVIEISLFSIMSQQSGITPYEDALRKYQRIIVDVEFYRYMTLESIMNIFPKHLHNIITLNHR